jgi:hypothetical protein
MVTKASLPLSAPSVAPLPPSDTLAESPKPKKKAGPLSAPPLRTAQPTLKGLAKIEAQFAARLEGVDFYRTSPIDWERPLANIWAGLDEPTQKLLKQGWLDRLLRPVQTNEVKWERLLMRTFFKQEYEVLLQRSITELPKEPGVALPESLRRASTRFLRDLAHELQRASLDREVHHSEARAGRDSDADPILAKLISLNGELVRRAQWGDPIELGEIQPRDFGTDIHALSPKALQLAQLARSGAQALAGMLKSAEIGPHGDRGEVLVLELKSGKRCTTAELYGDDLMGHAPSEWVKQPEQQLSVALAVLANPRHVGLRKVWDELYPIHNFDLRGTLLNPALSAPPPTNETGRRYERTLHDLAQAITTGADRSVVEGLAARLGKSEHLSEGRRARAVLQLFGAIEANPSSPGAVAALKQLITVGHTLPRIAEFYAGSLATRAMVMVDRAQSIDPVALDGIAFEVLSMTANPRAQAIRHTSLQKSGLFDDAQLNDLAARVLESEKAQLAQALQERRPDVDRFVAHLSKQRAAIEKGKVPPIEGGLPGAIEAAFALNTGDKTEKIQARIARVLPELEQAWGRAPCAANTLYGAALLAALEAAYPDDTLRAFLSSAQDLIQRVGSAGHHGGVQRYLGAFFAQAPLLSGAKAFSGPAYRLEGLEPTIDRLKMLPADPWAGLAHLQGLLALLPGDKANELSGPLERVTVLLLDGQEREAKAQLALLVPRFEAGFVRPPVLEDRIPFVSELLNAHLLLHQNGVWNVFEAVSAFRKTPTAENLATAQRDWAAVKGLALAKAAECKDRQRASIEIGVNLVDAILAPKVDGPWIEALLMLVDKARHSEKTSEKEAALPERPLEWLQGLFDSPSAKRVASIGHRELRAVGEALLQGAQAGPEQATATLGLAEKALERWAQVVRPDDPLWAEVIGQVSQDSAAARKAGVPDLALHLLIGALTDHTYTRSDSDSAGVIRLATSAFASRLRALEGHEPTPGVGPREFAAELLGSLRVLAGCIPEANPLRALLDAHLHAAWTALTQAKIGDCQEQIRQACRVGGSLSFEPFSRREFQRPAGAPAIERVKTSALQPGDLVRFPAPGPKDAEKIGVFGGRQGDQLYFSGPAGRTWSISATHPLQVERFSSLVALWESVANEPGAVGGWTHVPGTSRFGDEPDFGRLERHESGVLRLIAADGKPRPIDLAKVKDLQVGLSKTDYLELFFAKRLGEGMIASHDGVLTQGVLLKADDARIELRSIDGDLLVIERDRIDAVQSSRS